MLRRSTAVERVGNAAQTVYYYYYYYCHVDYYSYNNNAIWSLKQYISSEEGHVRGFLVDAIRFSLFVQGT